MPLLLPLLFFLPSLEPGSAPSSSSSSSSSKERESHLFRRIGASLLAGAIVEEDTGAEDVTGVTEEDEEEAAAFS